MNLFAQAPTQSRGSMEYELGRGHQFIIVLVALYYAKKRMDLYFAKQQAKTTIYRVKLIKDE